MNAYVEGTTRSAGATVSVERGPGAGVEQRGSLTGMRFGWVALAIFTLCACSDDETTSPGGGGGAGGGAGGAGGSMLPAPTALPQPSGTCPDFVDGDVTFSPAGIAPRQVRIFRDAAATGPGPLVFYWHGTGSSPVLEPPIGLGDAMEWVMSQGGIVAAPHHDPAAGTFPWFLTTGGDDETDLVLADEVLACAIEKVGVDTRQIHSIGMSAGGLQTTQMSYRRSGYLASVVTYSGGKLGSIPTQDEANLFAAMIFHGGMSDVVVVEFQGLSELYRDDLRDKGHFAFICDHGQGHTIPLSMNEQAAVMRFFQDHPYGTDPSPYAAALPADFPPYCAL
jgi:predicted esterase